MAWRNYKPRNKYHNKKITIEGQTFDSKKEARRFQDLRLLERSGAISNLQMQVKYILIPAQREPDTVGVRGGKKKGKLLEREVAYIADFVSIDTEKGETVVEDTKGVKTPEYIIKRKLMLYIHGIRIKEV